MGLKKIFGILVCVLLSSSLHAKTQLVDAVSVIVENEPITLFEIYKFSKQFNIPPKDAIELLVRQKLEIIQVRNMGIEVSDFEVNQQFIEIASRNNMNIQSFTNILLSENIKVEDYKNDLKMKMQRDRLYQYIFREKMPTVDTDSMKKYYDAHKNEFLKYDHFEVTRFQSEDPQLLGNVISPMSKVAGVETTRLRLKSDTTESQLIHLLTNTKTGTISPIVRTNDGYAKFIVHAKGEESILPYEQAQDMIMEKLSQDREKAVIEDFFEKLKSSASITVIRLP